MVTPILNVSPDTSPTPALIVAPAIVHVCKVTPQLSPVVGAKPLTTAEQPPSSNTDTFAGQVIVGFSASTIDTV